MRKKGIYIKKKNLLRTEIWAFPILKEQWVEAVKYLPKKSGKEQLKGRIRREKC